MKSTGKVRPISFFKANAPDVVRALARDRKPVVITLNGKARAILQDVESYDEMQETVAFLKLLALSDKDVDERRLRSARKAFKHIRSRLRG